MIFSSYVKIIKKRLILGFVIFLVQQVLHSRFLRQSKTTGNVRVNVILRMTYLTLVTEEKQ
jgi:hypothetical protein